MDSSHPSRGLVFFSGLLLSGALFLAKSEPAAAQPAIPPEAAVVLIAVPIVVTYAAVMTVVCTPVAAFKASDNPRGFGGAFADCFWFRSSASAADEPRAEAVQVEAQDEHEDKSYGD